MIYNVTMVLPKHRTTTTCPPQSTSFLDVLLVQETLSTTDTATSWIRSATTRPTGDALLRHAPARWKTWIVWLRLLIFSLCTSPNLFTQLVIVHGLYPDGWRIPLAFGLLPGKTQAHYKVFLDELSAFGVNPESILSFFVAL